MNNILKLQEELLELKNLKDALVSLDWLYKTYIERTDSSNKNYSQYLQRVKQLRSSVIKTIRVIKSFLGGVNDIPFEDDSVSVEVTWVGISLLLPKIASVIEQAPPLTSGGISGVPVERLH